MLRVSTSLPEIAVLRGGSVNFKQSLQDGADVLTSLTKIGYEPLDVLIDKEGAWTSKGFPTDAHAIFSQAHTVIDVTGMRKLPYQTLAARMGITLVFGEDKNTMSLSREDLYRILRQHAIKVPNSRVVRAHDELGSEVFRDIWTTYHTPMLIRPLREQVGVRSQVVRRFQDLESALKEYHGQGVATQVLTYRPTSTTSVAVLPYFRNEEIYVALPVDSFTEGNALPNKNSDVSPQLHIPEFRKEHIRSLAKQVYKAIGATGPVCIDFIYHNKEYYVVNVSTHPSLRKDGRFTRSLNATAVELGHYIHEKIKQDFGI